MQRIGECSIIIPTLNEEDHLPGCLESIRSLQAEVIVVDGGSSDRTCQIAQYYGARLLHSRCGRGVQMRAGVEIASGDTLFFLHADSRLSADAVRLLTDIVNNRSFTLGTFRLRLDGSSMLYRIYEWFTRFDSIWTSFGDQGIVIRHELYDRLGGFPDWPLLEDVALLQLGRRNSIVHPLQAEILTSARRFERTGIVRQQLRNGRILLRYLLGVSPASLAREYLSEPPGAGTSLERILPPIVGTSLEPSLTAHTIYPQVGELQ